MTAPFTAITGQQAGPVQAFSPPDGSAWLYPGDVMHARMKPRPHRFAYKVFCLLIDLDRLDRAARLSPFFSIGRFNLLSFNPADHGPGWQDSRRQPDLKTHVAALLAEAGQSGPVGRVLLLCYPRLLGFVFNPISVYFIYDPEGCPSALVYEVRNTFGEMHTYVCPITEGQMSEAGIRQERDKLFYVSPFMSQQMRYRFRILPPGPRVSVRILETDNEGPILAATFTGRQTGLTSAAIVKACVSLPFMTLKVVAGIHWEAMKLWFKGIEFYNRPPPPSPVSFRDPDPERTDAHHSRAAI
jgi:uncharacterized protein